MSSTKCDDIKMKKCVWWCHDRNLLACWYCIHPIGRKMSGPFFSIWDDEIGVTNVMREQEASCWERRSFFSEASVPPLWMDTRFPIHRHFGLLWKLLWAISYLWEDVSHLLLRGSFLPTSEKGWGVIQTFSLWGLSPISPPFCANIYIYIYIYLHN